MSFVDKFRIKRLEKILKERSETLLKASERWPDLYHTVVKAYSLQADCKKRLRGGKPSVSDILRDPAYYDRASAILKKIGWSYLKFDNAIWYGHYHNIDEEDASDNKIPITRFLQMGCENISYIQEIQAIQEKKAPLPALGSWLELIYALPGDYRIQFKTSDYTDFGMQSAIKLINVFSASAWALDLLKEFNWSIEACIAHADGEHQIIADDTDPSEAESPKKVPTDNNPPPPTKPTPCFTADAKTDDAILDGKKHQTSVEQVRETEETADLVSPSSPQNILDKQIPPEDRTRPMSYKDAARHIGQGKGKDAAEWVSKCVKDGTIPCVSLSRQKHVFSKKSFPKSSWNYILPEAIQKPTDPNSP